MSEENVRIVRQALEAWSAGDLDRTLEAVHPDVVWITSGAIPDMRREYRGHDGVRGFWEDWKGAWQELTLEPLRMVDAGDSVIVLARFDGIARGNLKVSMNITQVHTMSEGKLIRLESFVDWDEAVRSVGLDPTAVRA
jgi:ketosteroid isomerase-like protein